MDIKSNEMHCISYMHLCIQNIQVTSRSHPGRNHSSLFVYSGELEGIVSIDMTDPDPCHIISNLHSGAGSEGNIMLNMLIYFPAKS